MNLAEQTPPAKPAAQRFTKICAWCRCELGPLPYDATNHSFGICVSCFALYYGELLDDPEAPADSWQSPFGRAPAVQGSSPPPVAALQRRSCRV